MIRNGVIDVQKEFAERRYRAETDREFKRIKAVAMEKHGIDIEICRETYQTFQRKFFAMIGDFLVETCSQRLRIAPWKQVRREGGL